jgi:hypothetical protein
MSPRHAGSAEAKNDNSSTTEALATASLGDTTRRQVATHAVMCEQQHQGASSTEQQVVVGARTAKLQQRKLANGARTARHCGEGVPTWLRHRRGSSLQHGDSAWAQMLVRKQRRAGGNVGGDERHPGNGYPVEEVGNGSTRSQGWLYRAREGRNGCWEKVMGEERIDTIHGMQKLSVNSKKQRGIGDVAWCSTEQVDKQSAESQAISVVVFRPNSIVRFPRRNG